MQQSITFSGELDERSIDREVDALNRRLQEAGNIEINAEGGLGDGLGGGLGDGMERDGLGGGMGEPGGGGAAAVVGGLATKIPKPVAGVTAATALPVALAGGVGVGMLSKMDKASASMQTSASMLSNAWNSVWRELGDKLDGLFIRDVVKSLSDDFRGVAESIRTGDSLGGFNEFMTGEGRDDGIISGLGAILGGVGGGAAGIKGGAAAGAALGSVIPGAGTAAGAVIGGGLGGLAGIFSGSRIGSAIADTLLKDFPGWVGGVIDVFPNWLQNSPGIIPTFPGWMGKIVPKFPGWPTVKADWPGWPNVPGEWPGWPNIDGMWPGWPDLSIPNDFWPDLGNPFGGGGGGGGGDGGIIGDFRDLIGIQSGGRITKTGVAEVHRGELVADPDRLVNDLADAIDQAGSGGGGGGSAEVDTSTLESQLNNVERELRRLRSAMDVTVQVGREEIARASQQGQIEDVSDTDPTV